MDSRDHRRAEGTLNVAKFKDFGEKIGGARKDFYAGNALTVDDFDEMNAHEAAKLVTKANVWPVPDYAAKVADGMPIGIAFFTKKVRDSFAAKPVFTRNDDTPEKKRARQAEYIETANKLMRIVDEVRTVQDARNVFHIFMIEGGYLMQQVYCYQRTEKGTRNPCITSKLAEVLCVDAWENRSDEAFESYYATCAADAQFCVAKENKVPAGYQIYSLQGKYIVTRSNIYLGSQEFDTYEEALAFAKEHAATKRRGSKKRFTPPQLEHIARTGPDYRHNRQISGNDFLTTFGFRGGEFGNWMSQNDRAESLNMGFEALKDLSACLGIMDEDIALHGTLAIAFGARGHNDATAHYEPERTVINLTKMRGAGSLAHEWWHAFDDFLGSRMGATRFLMSEAQRYPLFTKLLHAMNGLEDGTVTDFRRGSEAMNGSYAKDSGRYWTDPVEMSARAFACYVMDKLEHESDYLVAHAETAAVGEWKAYPVGDERKAINLVFDEIFADLKARGILREAKPKSAVSSDEEPKCQSAKKRIARVEVPVFEDPASIQQMTWF